MFDEAARAKVGLDPRLVVPQGTGGTKYNVSEAARQLGLTRSQLAY
ncbi:helix-turn-helix domain-containing protein [Acidovorax benzenivorans]